MNACLFCCSLSMVRVLTVVIIGKRFQLNAFVVCHVVQLYSVVNIGVMFGDVVCYSMVWYSSGYVGV